MSACHLNLSDLSHFFCQFRVILRSQGKRTRSHNQSEKKNFSTAIMNLYTAGTALHASTADMFEYALLLTRNSKRHDHSLLYLLLIISGDIQLNPSPAPVRSFPNGLSGECKRILWQLHRLKVKLINGDLHQQFLTEYGTNQVIPTALKIKLRPQIDAVNDEFLKTWNDTISGTSFRLMDLLLKKQQANCSSLSKQINDKLLTLSNKLDSEQFQEVSMWLDTQDKAIRKDTDT